ncbi:UDP-glucose:glycoprotein glucosyltransferase 2, partial [Actinomortierella wolfii]
ISSCPYFSLRLSYNARIGSKAALYRPNPGIGGYHFGSLRKFKPTSDSLDPYPLGGSSPTTGDIAPTPQALYEQSLKVIQESGHVTTNALSTLKMSLAVHSASAGVQAHYHLYNSTILPARSKESGFDPTCSVWIDWYGRQLCDLQEFMVIVSAGLDKYRGSKLTPTTMDLDRVLPLNTPSDLFTILYANVLDPAFRPFHSYLAQLAAEHGLRYSLRYIPASDHTQQEPLSLAGFGAELALKSTDYLVIDDRDLGHDLGKQSSQKVLKQLDSEDELFFDLGPLVTHHVVGSEEPLKMLVRLTRDLPKYQRRIPEAKMDKYFLREITANGAHYSRQERNHVWLNGQVIPHHKMNPFNLLRILRRERRAIENLLPLQSEEGDRIKRFRDLMIDSSLAMQDSEAPAIFDVRDKSQNEQGSVVSWLNDLETDRRYATWTDELVKLFEPARGSPFHQLRKNYINALFALDMSSPQSMELISVELANYVQQLVPIRFGVLPLITSENGDDAQVAKLWRHILNRHGLKAGMNFLRITFVSRTQKSLAIFDAAKKAFEEVTHGPTLKNTATPEMSASQVLASGSVYDQWAAEARKMSERVGIDAPSMFINGKHFYWNGDHGPNLVREGPLVQHTIASLFYEGKVKKSTDLYDYLLTQPNVYPRRNPYVFVNDDSNPLRMVDLTMGIENSWDDQIFIEKESKSEDAPPPSISFWKNLLSGVVEGKDFAIVLEAAVQSNTDAAWMTKVQDVERVRRAMAERTSFLRDILNAKPYEKYILLNGRVIGPLRDHFSTIDIHLLTKYEQRTRLNDIAKRTKDACHRTTSSLMMKVSSLVYSTHVQEDQGLYDINDPYVTRNREYENLSREFCEFSVNTTTSGEEPWFHFQVVLDPMSEKGQKWAQILEVLSKLERVKIDVLLLPQTAQNEPLKRFYRYVLDSELRFEPSSGQLIPPSATFLGMPESSLLTLGVDVMPSWVVTSKSCIHDMDNLKLASLSGTARAEGVEADFELQHILVEGFARDITRRAPPKGAQFLLGTKTEPHVVDTLVMANMGYFQLKANPGVWEMSLRPGRTLEIFEIESIGANGWLAGGVKDEKRDVVINNLEGMVLYPRLVRKPGMELANVQDETAAKGGIWNSIKSSLQNLTGKKEVTTKKADINIFSVASGHLYERFLSIMILSVIKNTKSSVKFWFIENFLSPSFKDFIPHMAEKYGFDYELVTYKWPHWLRAQTEKQRIIWAYKILFLDVLFPLDLDKVIFVDADQIVRTDMKELVDLDLHGAPYGYTPMCNDRKEMEGFRFWNQGYWKNHLRGLPYHISALYVVDLVRFRQLQAGDQLRQHYQALSADPNSLANLDQDLPNNMQHQVPIFSLQQEWLWCETWCSDEGLKKAKTIDLCNNPLTKEPKLDRARRQIKEWEEYDNEATEFAREVARKLREQKSAASQTEGTKADNQQEHIHGDGSPVLGHSKEDIPLRDEL